MSPRDAADVEWPLSEGMQVGTLPPFWIAMIISSWSIKLLKLPSVTLTHVCGTNSHNWWAKGLPGVGVVKIFYDSDSSGRKSFRLRLWLHSPASDSTALAGRKRTAAVCCALCWLLNLCCKQILALIQGFSTFFLPFTPCQLPNIKFTSVFFCLLTSAVEKTMYCNFSIIKFTPRIGKIYPHVVNLPSVENPCSNWTWV